MRPVSAKGTSSDHIPNTNNYNFINNDNKFLIIIDSILHQSADTFS